MHPLLIPAISLFSLHELVSERPVLFKRGAGAPPPPNAPTAAAPVALFQRGAVPRSSTSIDARTFSPAAIAELVVTIEGARYFRLELAQSIAQSFQRYELEPMTSPGMYRLRPLTSRDACTAFVAAQSAIRQGLTVLASFGAPMVATGEDAAIYIQPREDALRLASSAATPWAVLGAPDEPKRTASSSSSSSATASPAPAPPTSAPTVASSAPKQSRRRPRSVAASAPATPSPTSSSSSNGASSHASPAIIVTHGESVEEG